EVSVVEAETISAWLERRDCRHLGHLVPAWRNNEGQFPGPIQDETPIVERAGAQHRPIGVEDLLPRKDSSVGRQPTNFIALTLYPCGRTAPSPTPSPTGRMVASSCSWCKNVSLKPRRASVFSSCSPAAIRPLQVRLSTAITPPGAILDSSASRYAEYSVLIASMNANSIPGARRERTRRAGSLMTRTRSVTPARSQ